MATRAPSTRVSKPPSHFQGFVAPASSGLRRSASARVTGSSAADAATGVLNANQTDARLIADPPLSDQTQLVNSNGVAASGQFGSGRFEASAAPVQIASSLPSSPRNNTQQAMLARALSASTSSLLSPLPCPSSLHSSLHSSSMPSASSSDQQVPQSLPSSSRQSPQLLSSQPLAAIEPEQFDVLGEYSQGDRVNVSVISSEDSESESELEQSVCSLRVVSPSLNPAASDSEVKEGEADKPQHAESLTYSVRS